jgi:hypothetical protein
MPIKAFSQFVPHWDIFWEFQKKTFHFQPLFIERENRGFPNVAQKVSSNLNI